MGWFSTTAEEDAAVEAAICHASAEKLKTLNNEKLIMLALYRSMVGDGHNSALTDELLRRATGKEMEKHEKS